MSKEIAAKILRAIDTLSLNLANHGHVWSNKERSEYEKAVKLLLSIIG